MATVAGRSGAATVAFTGGGTGGHIFPGLSVIEAFRETPEGGAARIVWIGSKKPLDREIVERAGVEFVAVPSGKLRRYLSLRTVADAFRVLGGYFAAKKALKALEPAFLFSKGGYVSVPPVLAARKLGIPVVTHESDLTPGLATRINARFVEAIFLAYDESRAYLSPELAAKARVTGNPLRKAILSGDAARGRKYLGVPEGKKVLLALGGSQGAQQINALVEEILPDLAGICFTVHQTGEANYAANKAKDDPGFAFSYRAAPFFKEEIADVLAAADLVLTRAGAGALWECGATGKPMILIPLGSAASRGDQYLNARRFEAAGAAIVLSDAEDGTPARPDTLLDAVSGVLGNEPRRRAMSEAARSLCRPDSASLIAAELSAILARGRK